MPVAVASSIEAQLADIRDDVAELRELLLRLVGDRAAGAATAWLTAEQAAELCGRTPQCLRNWCRHLGIGILVHGR
jgi:hypothetical protein